MKKKLLLIVAAIVIVSLLTLSLAACGEKIIDKIIGGGAIGSDSLEIDMDTAEANMEALANGDGFEVKYNYTDSDGDKGYFVVGEKGGVSWMINTEDGKDIEGVALKKDGNAIYYYEYDSEKRSFEYESTYNNSDASGDSTVRSLSAAYTYWFYFADLFDGSLLKGADTTVAGRPCHTYSLSYGIAFVGFNMTYNVAVDKALGITLKVDASATSEGETEALSYVVTSFNTGSSVTVPTLKDPIAFSNALPENIYMEYKDGYNGYAYVLNKVGNEITVQVTKWNDLIEDYETYYVPFADRYFIFSEQYNGWISYERSYIYDYELEEYVLSSGGWFSSIDLGIVYRGYELFDELDLEFMIDYDNSESINAFTKTNDTKVIANNTCTKYTYEDDYLGDVEKYYSSELKFILKYVVYVDEYDEGKAPAQEVTYYIPGNGLLEDENCPDLD